MKISIIITAFKEPNTIGKAIEAIKFNKIKTGYEILVVCPDKATADAALKYKNVKYIKDQGKGKPAALNIAFKKAKGDILVLTDGDVFVDNNSINNLVKYFSDKEVGVVSGHPVSTNNKNNMLGFWSHLLVDLGAHNTRMALYNKGKFVVCSGYLMALRNKIINNIPENSLADDAVISNLIYAKGYKTAYAKDAIVHVKFPTKFSDWIKQKRRSAGGYIQIKELINRKDEMRSFSKESKNVFKVFSYCKTIKEFFWTIILIFARLYLWLVIFVDIKLRRKNFNKMWKRVESTK